jgi:Ca2+-binding RTX toxin-like protein
MATVPGAQFQPTTIPGLPEIFFGSGSALGTPQIVSPSGATIDLVGGSYAITDNGIDGDTISVFGGSNMATGGSAAAIITAVGDNNTVTGGSGGDTITAVGNNDSVTGGSGSSLINVVGTGETVTGGGGNDILNVFGSGDTVFGGAGADTIGLYGDSDMAKVGPGADTIIATGTADTVTAGSGNAQIDAFGPQFTFHDSANLYNDTVVGFSQSAGDTIKISDTGHTVASTALVNGGADTLITLSDSSTILLKGVTHVDTGLFS